MCIRSGKTLYDNCQHGTAIKYPRWETKEINKWANIPSYNHHTSNNSLEKWGKSSKLLRKEISAFTFLHVYRFITKRLTWKINAGMGVNRLTWMYDNTSENCPSRLVAKQSLHRTEQIPKLYAEMENVSQASNMHGHKIHKHTLIMSFCWASKKKVESLYLPATKRVPLAAPKVEMATHKGIIHRKYGAPPQSPMIVSAKVWQGLKHGKEKVGKSNHHILLIVSQVNYCNLGNMYI